MANNPKAVRYFAPGASKPKLTNRVAVSVRNVVGERQSEIFHAVAGEKPFLQFEVLPQEAHLAIAILTILCCAMGGRRMYRPA
jgi:hypothetical protein